MIRQFAIMVTALCITVLAGCGTSPKVDFYTLGSGAAAERPEAKATYVVGIGPVTVPDMVDRPQVVTVAGANQVAINEFARWAEPLKSQIPRIIAADLTQLLDGAYVFAYPQSDNVNADYKVLIDVQRFDSALGDGVTVEALWTVRAAKGGAVKTGRAVAREPAGGAGYDALVAAHGRALAAISRDIAGAIRSSR